MENRPGGALTTGLAFIAKSEPDGYTIAMGPVGALAITRHLVKKLPYDIERDFQPIALVTRGQMLLAVTPKLPVRTVEELVALAKAKPGTLVYASSSAGSPGHVGGELFKFMTGTDIAHCPTGRGDGDHRPNLRTGPHDAGEPEFDRTLCPVGGCARTGRLQCAPVADLSRLADHRRGRSTGLEVTTWNGVIGPAGMARPVVDKLSAAINRAVRTRAFESDWPPWARRWRVARLRLRRDHSQGFAKWLDVIRELGIKLD